MNTTQMQVKYGTAEALAFLHGTGSDAAGRTVDDYLQFDADTWEQCHDHIQWAFPSNIASEFNLNAPVVDMEDFSSKLNIHGYHNVKDLLANYLTSLGFFEDNMGWHANLSHERAKIWLSPNNHNYRRITRVLNLLHWIDEDLALDLLNEFLSVATDRSDVIWTYDTKSNPVYTIDIKTVIYWTKAATGNL